MQNIKSEKVHDVKSTSTKVANVNDDDIVNIVESNKVSFDYKLEKQSDNDGGGVSVETIEARLSRLKKVKKEDIVSGKFSWIDEVCLVAIGLKPIAVTHFDTLDSHSWNDEVETYLIENYNISSFAMMEYPLNVETPVFSIKKGAIHFQDFPNFESPGIEQATSIGSILETKTDLPRIFRNSITMQCNDMIWFRPENRRRAVLYRHLGVLQRQYGRSWRYPYYDIVQGLLLGYSEKNIVGFIIMIDFDDYGENGKLKTVDDVMPYMKQSKKYIETMFKKYKQS